MTTSITDIVDLTRILNEQPEWRDAVRSILLGQELMDLPRRLGEFMPATNRGLGDLESGQTRHNAGAYAMHSEQVRVWQSFTRIGKRFARSDSNADLLLGIHLEREVHANIISIVSRALGFNRARILQSDIVARGPDLQDIIDDAEEQGIITADQGCNLELADIIMSARRKSDRQQCYVVMEVSVGIRNDDITRARDLAQTLAAAQQLPALPAVVGGSIAQQQRNLADSLGVAVVIERSLQQALDDGIDFKDAFAKSSRRAVPS